MEAREREQAVPTTRTMTVPHGADGRFGSAALGNLTICNRRLCSTDHTRPAQFGQSYQTFTYAYTRPLLIIHHPHCSILEFVRLGSITSSQRFRTDAASIWHRRGSYSHLSSGSVLLSADNPVKHASQKSSRLGDNMHHLLQIFIEPLNLLLSVERRRMLTCDLYKGGVISTSAFPELSWRCDLNSHVVYSSMSLQ